MKSQENKILSFYLSKILPSWMQWKDEVNENRLVVGLVQLDNYMEYQSYETKN